MASTAFAAWITQNHLFAILWAAAGMACVAIAAQKKVFYPGGFGMQKRNRKPLPTWLGRFWCVLGAAFCFWNAIQSLRK